MGKTARKDIVQSAGVGDLKIRDPFRLKNCPKQCPSSRLQRLSS